MANTTLNTRIQLKYDTYSNWTTNNPVLLSGEIAVVVVPASSGAVPNEPTVLFKVGNGSTNFNALQWVAAPAADVYSWAKASTKPTYTADEIQGLDEYISGKIEDTDTQYQIIASGTNGIQLQSRPKTGGEWSNVGSPITIAGVPSTEGVPTDYLLSPAGWVAPPSGGDENWELIIDHVVPETVASVLIDQDLNGEAFSLKKWALLTIWLPDENVSTQERCQVGFLPSSGWNNGSLYETAKAPTNEETASCTLAFCSFTNGLIKLDDIYWSVNFTNIAYQPNRQYQGLSQSGGIKIDSSTKEIVSTYRDSYATCVKINTISRTAVRKGSVIRLWGVRA